MEVGKTIRKCGRISTPVGISLAVYTGLTCYVSNRSLCGCVAESCLGDEGQIWIRTTDRRWKTLFEEVALHFGTAQKDL